MNTYRQLQQKVYSIIYPEGVPLEVSMSIEQLEEIAGDVGYFDTEQYIKEKPLEGFDILRAIQLKTRQEPLLISEMVEDYSKVLYCGVDLSKPIQDQDEKTLQSLLKLLY